MSLITGIPVLPSELVSRIRPAIPTVCPSWTATRVRIKRWLKVGELMLPVVSEATSLTSWEMSRLTSPPELTRGVTSMITPVSR